MPVNVGWRSVAIMHSSSQPLSSLLWKSSQQSWVSQRRRARGTPPLHTLGSIHSRLSQLRLQRLRHTVTHGEVSFKSACKDRIFFPLSGIQVSFHLGIQHGGSHKIFLCDQLGLKLFIRVYKHKPSIWWIIFWFMILFIVCTGTVFTCYKC